MQSFFPLDVLGGIWDLIESVSFWILRSRMPPLNLSIQLYSYNYASCLSDPLSLLERPPLQSNRANIITLGRKRCDIKIVGSERAERQESGTNDRIRKLGINGMKIGYRWGYK